MSLGRHDQVVGSRQGDKPTNDSVPELGLPAELIHGREIASPSLTYQDNSNRSIEHEMMEMTKNLSMQSFAVTLLTTQMGMLQAAIREQA